MNLCNEEIRLHEDFQRLEEHGTTEDILTLDDENGQAYMTSSLACISGLVR